MIINVWGQDWIVDFDYQPFEPGSYWEPPVLEELTINSIFVPDSQTDLIQYLDDSLIEAIYNAVLHQIKQKEDEESY